MKFTLSVSAVSLVALAQLALANVIDLTPENFDSIVGTGKPALVEFFAPWCGHCKTLAPTYAKLADAFVGKNVVIAKTDADGEGRELGQRFQVGGYPTLKWFNANDAENPVDYNGGRDLDSLAKLCVFNLFLCVSFRSFPRYILLLCFRTLCSLDLAIPCPSSLIMLI